MPGLFGFFFKQKNKNEGVEFLAQQMSKKLQHFATYKSDNKTIGKIGIGHINLNSSMHRKIYVDPATKAIVSFFGEIYDYIGLDYSFVQTFQNNPELGILKLYQEYGRKTPEKLNGDFNIAIYDPKKDTLVIFNDRFGFRHLYLYEDDNIIMFSPEIKAFDCYPGFNKALDEHGIADYFNYSYQFGDKTLLKHVTLLPPASITTINNKTVTRHIYWEPRYRNTRGLNELHESVETGYELFVQSMSRRIGNRKKLIIPLSGGLDSRLILSVAKNFSQNLTTFTMGIPGCLDHKIALEVCNTLGINNHHFVRTDPEFINKYGPDMIYLSEGNYATLGSTRLLGAYNKMGANYDGFLNGIFGGHISFGSSYYTTLDLNSNYSSHERISRIIRGFNGHRFDKFLASAASKKLIDIVSEYKEKSILEELSRADSKSNESIFQQDYIFLYNRIRRGMNALDLNRFYYNSLLPFASYELFDFYLTLSPDLTLNHHLYKKIYENKLPDLANITWQNTGVNLYQKRAPWKESLNQLKKHLLWYTTKISLGKINILDNNLDDHPDQDFRQSKNSKKWISNILLSDQCHERGYFHKDGLMKLLNWEISGGSAMPEISKIVIFEIWARNFLD